MNRKEFRADIAKTFEECLVILDKKNADYAGEKDPFENFNNSRLAHVSVPQAILVRIVDKISRMGNLLVRAAQVKNETIEDTIMDAINYLAILLAYIHSKNENRKR